jgi:hypothetical protein
MAAMMRAPVSGANTAANRELTFRAVVI